MWDESEVRTCEMRMGSDGIFTGTVHLESKDGRRGYQAELRGKISAENGRMVRFDGVTRGDFWGEGPYTRNAPPGKFPLAVAFSLADGSDIADKIPPQGSRGWIDGYLR